MATKMTFRQLVDTKFVDKGETVSMAVAKVFVESGVSQQPIWGAYRGQRVTADTAEALKEWAKAEYGVELDVEAMVTAPTAKEFKQSQAQ